MASNNDVVALAAGALLGGVLAWFATREDDKKPYKQETVGGEGTTTVEGVVSTSVDMLDPLDTTYLALMAMNMIDSGAMRIANLNNRFKHKHGSEGRPFVDAPGVYFQESADIKKMSPLEVFYLYLKYLGHVEMSAMRVANMSRSLRMKTGSEGRPFMGKELTDKLVYLQDETGKSMMHVLSEGIDAALKASNTGALVGKLFQKGELENVLRKEDLVDSLQALQEFNSNATTLLNHVADP
jgi:hypothetical protein